MTREGIGETMSFLVDLEVPEAARLIAERLSVEMEGRIDLYGYPEYNGFDAGGAWLWLRGTPWSLRPGENRRLHPEPSILWVWGTLLGEEIRTALSGPPVRLDHLGPGPTREGLDRQAAWRRLLGELRAEGWQIETNGNGEGMIQAEGFLPSGREFYLNFKYDTAYLQVLSGEGADYWEQDLPYPQAGYMKPDEAVRVLRELHVNYLTR